MTVQEATIKLSPQSMEDRPRVFSGCSTNTAGLRGGGDSGPEQPGSPSLEGPPLPPPTIPLCLLAHPPPEPPSQAAVGPGTELPQSTGPRKFTLYFQAEECFFQVKPQLVK